MTAAPIIHFLGLGAIGTLYATGLQRALGVTVKGILSSPNASPVRSLRSLDGSAVSTVTFERDTGGTDHISHLVVSTKAQTTLPALRPLYPRISSTTCILLLQNGALGVQASLTRDLKTVGKPLPQFLLGSTTHGVTKESNSERESGHPCYKHTGLGVTYLGAMSSPLSDESQVLLRLFSLLPPDFNVKIIQESAELKRQLLIKVIVNCCLNCLSSIFLVRNGLLVESEHGRALIRQLVSESHSLLEADLGGMSQKDLEEIVMDVARKTAKNRNSMMADVFHGRDTEIDYILGYILDLAKERGMSMHSHQLLYSLTLMKAHLVKNYPDKAHIIE